MPFLVLINYCVDMQIPFQEQYPSDSFADLIAGIVIGSKIGNWGFPSCVFGGIVLDNCY